MSKTVGKMNNQIKEYNILSTIVLGFLVHNDSYDVLIDPGNNRYLKFDGEDIIFVDSKGREQTSHTMNSALKLWVDQGKIEERATVK